MHSYSLRSFRQNLTRAVQQVAAGDVVTITKRGREIARLVAPTTAGALKPMPSMAKERAAMIADGAVVTDSTVIALREEERA
jgi:prevent-host-death family protein